MTAVITAPDRVATRGQLRDLAIALGRFGLTDRDRALGYCSAIAARPITSRKDLTTREASAVLDHLDHHVPPRRLQ